MSEWDASLEVLRALQSPYARLQQLEQTAVQSRGHAEPNPYVELALVAVAVSCTDALVPGATTEEGAWARVTAFADCPGWVRHRSVAVATPLASEAALDPAEAGPPLAGEWVSKPSVSHRLAPDGETTGTLRIWTYSERVLEAASAALEPGEIPALRQIAPALERPFDELSIERPGDLGGALVYHVYWGGTPSDPAGIRRLFHRLAGHGHIAAESAPARGPAMWRIRN